MFGIGILRPLVARMTNLSNKMLSSVAFLCGLVKVNET